MENYLKFYREKQPGQMGGTGSAWSRGIGELMRETMALGFGKFINTYTTWLDSCLLGMPGPFPVFNTGQHLIHRINIFYNLEIEHPYTDMICPVFKGIPESNLGLNGTGG